jgi:hypothetical protein
MPIGTTVCFVIAVDAAAAVGIDCPCVPSADGEELLSGVIFELEKEDAVRFELAGTADPPRIDVINGSVAIVCIEVFA